MKTSEKLAKLKKHIVPPQISRDDGVGLGANGMWFSPINAASNELNDLDLALILRERMSGIDYMGGWLRVHAGVPSEDLHPFRVQKHTLNWIDELIKEFKAKGD